MVHPKEEINYNTLFSPVGTNGFIVYLALNTQTGIISRVFSWNELCDLAPGISVIHYAVFYF